jgi:hypothetical protein
VTIHVISTPERSASRRTHFLPVTDILSTRPSNLDVDVNLLWALSLIFSLTCALSAILVGWSSIGSRNTYPIPDAAPSLRLAQESGLSAYTFDGPSHHRFDQVISAIPLLLHLSLLLLGADLITCFFSLNDVVAYTVRPWLSIPLSEPYTSSSQSRR